MQQQYRRIIRGRVYKKSECTLFTINIKLNNNKTDYIRSNINLEPLAVHKENIIERIIL